MTKKPLGIYIHIPFCVRKCDYCDFLSAPADAETRKSYVNTLLCEIEQETGGGQFEEYEAATVFFGGGTPSLLEASCIGDILCKLKSYMNFTRDAEMTLEMNPGTVTKEALAGYRDAGINRISIGVQSFQNEELAALGRIHDVQDVYRLWEWTKETGYQNRNLDLMTGIPGQSEESLADTLARAAALGPEHVSAYSLIVEEGTPFARRYPHGAVDEDTDRRLYGLAGELLRKSGYARYEISNYAKDGYECRHNLAYWTRGEYLGLGAGASSMIRNVRFCNAGSLHAYVHRHADISDRRTGHGSSGGGFTEETFKDYVNRHEEVAYLTAQDCMAETMFLGLRLKKGVLLDDFLRTYGVPMEQVYGEVLRRHIQNGLLTVQGGRVLLTDRGTDVSNYVMADFLP